MLINNKELQKHYNHIINNCDKIESENIYDYLILLSKKLNLNYKDLLDDFLFFWKNYH